MHQESTQQHQISLQHDQYQPQHLDEHYLQQDQRKLPQQLNELNQQREQQEQLTSSTVKVENNENNDQSRPMKSLASQAIPKTMIHASKRNSEWQITGKMEMLCYENNYTFVADAGQENCSTTLSYNVANANLSLNPIILNCEHSSSSKPATANNLKQQRICIKNNGLYIDILIHDIKILPWVRQHEEDWRAYPVEEDHVMRDFILVILATFHLLNNSTDAYRVSLNFTISERNGIEKLFEYKEVRKCKHTSSIQNSSFRRTIDIKVLIKYIDIN